jgi:hypothetical protein
MNPLRRVIYEKLKNSVDLVNMLAINKSSTNKRSAPSRANSILSPIQISKDLATPFLSISFGLSTREQNLNINVDLINQVFYIRVYTNQGEGFLQNENIQKKIYNILHNANLVLSNDLHIITMFERYVAEGFDEGLNLLYTESQYRVLYIK